MRKHLKLAALLATTILILSSCSTQKQVRLVLLPDIQTYSRLYPDILRSRSRLSGRWNMQIVLILFCSKGI